MNRQDYFVRDNYDYDEGRWNALDSESRHPHRPCNSNDPLNEAVQLAEIDQTSSELVIIRDSCDVTVDITDTQIAASLQAALQVAIAVVINITIADSDRAEKVTQELLENSQIRQSSRQKVVVFNSRTVDVATTDTDVAISLQLLLQILVSLAVELDIL